MDTEKLLQALDKAENAVLFDYTPKKIKAQTIEILQELELSNECLKHYVQQLSGYIYVDDIQHLRMGAFIRWIPLSNPDNPTLQKGGVLCEIKNTEKGVVLVCKTFGARFFQLKMGECLLFQKLTSQQRVLLDVLGHLST